jgi:hypothetical protein
MEDKITIEFLEEDTIQADVSDINYIPGYKVAEEERRANELEREAYYEDIQKKVEEGYFNGERGPQGIQGPQGPKGDAGAIKLIPVNELPSENIETDAIYLKPSENPAEENVYDEYIYTNGNWEKISGGATVDLTGYATEQYVQDAIAETSSSNVTEPSYYVNDEYVVYTSKECSGKVCTGGTGTGAIPTQWRDEFTKVCQLSYETGKKFIMHLTGDGNTVRSLKPVTADKNTIDLSFDMYIASQGQIMTTTGKIFYNIVDGVFSMYNHNIKGNSILNLTKTNTDAYTPSSDYNPSTKLYTDKTHYERMSGYDASKTQVLKNINGTLTWVDE